MGSEAAGMAVSGCVQCVCGKVCVELQCPTPVYRLQCGCCDCRQALQWAELQGGPAAPRMLADLWYFQNNFSFRIGRQNTKWVKLRERGNSVRCVTTCCYTTIMAHHPFYQNNVVMVMADAAKMDVPEIDISARIYLKDVAKENINLLPPFEGVVIDKDNLDGKGKAERERLTNLFSKAVDISSGTNTHQEIEEKGVTVLNLTEYLDLLAS